MYVNNEESRNEYANKRGESIVIQETTLKEKTVLDYRDFFNTSFADRTRSDCIFNESFVYQTGLDDLD